MRSTILRLGICFGLGFLVVTGLFALSQQRTYRDNGFYRLLPPHPLTRSMNIDLGFNTYYFAGAVEDTVYLGNYTAPLHLLKVSLSNMDTTHVKLQIIDEENMRYRMDNQVKIQAPYFYYLDGMSPKLKRGMLNQWKANSFMYDSAYFNSAIPIGSKTIALKTMSAKTKERILGIESDEEPYVKLNPEILERQIDGVFCTDGKLMYNEHLSQLVYIYYYRNEYMVMDRDMQLLYRARTIDTISKARIKPTSLSSGEVRKLASTPNMVNLGAYAAGPYLYVQAAGMAKNDNETTFNQTSTFDVYNLKDRTYTLSFQLQPFKNFKVSRFLVTNNYLVAIQGISLVSYKIHHTAFQKKLDIKLDI